jgi:hypothetical protein
LELARFVRSMRHNLRRVDMDKIENFVFSLTLALCGLITFVQLPLA